MTLETRTVTMTAEQWQFVKDLVAEYRADSDISAMRRREEGEPQSAYLYQVDADFAANILNILKGSEA